MTAPAGILCLVTEDEMLPCPVAVAIDDGHGGWAVLSCNRAIHDDPLHHDSLACEDGLWFAEGDDPREASHG